MNAACNKYTKGLCSNRPKSTKLYLPQIQALQYKKSKPFFSARKQKVALMILTA
jgi:hypothetical protein